ncbi:glycoside hydrolase family 3 C-terminal domain-containing protein [Paenarthrobacter nicotinovorans]|uniref:glycoside hydrolase family 3 C-terminal domain-containing protein n=1 Tax=Paenarthrobacter nicotinovorans TaxID=29320 RepID=UPI0037486E5F
MRHVPIESKIALTSGADFWHTHAVPEGDLPEIMLTDGPHGVRKQSGATDHIGLNDSIQSTCFPPAVALSATWDRALVEKVGSALGEECRALGVGILLGPGANLKRSPLCGRNFEYFSEDPFITGELAAAFVAGVQSQGVGTSLKHFAANNQETDRMRRDSQIDPRTLREMYLRAFEKVVIRARPWTVMCSYNKVNGTYASQNSFLLTDVLRGEWGFEGFVVSDWGAVSDPVASLQAGLDLEMPPSVGHATAIADALSEGRLATETIDRAFERIERVLRQANETLSAESPHLDVDGHHKLALHAAEKSIVLLENDGVLPLSPETKVAVIGEFARTPRYQGAGSSRVNPTRLENALHAIAGISGQDVPFASGFSTDPAKPAHAFAHDEAVAVAAEADVVLVFLGLGEHHESEGYDRDSLELPVEQTILLDAVLEVNPNVVVVLSNGSSVLVSSFAGRVRAVVEGWLLGQAGGPALANVLYGIVNPSGKLTETIPVRAEDVPSHPFFPGDASGVRYGEGLFVGYRGYDARATTVAYPFGHGLSYTSFSYSALSVEPVKQGLEVGVTVTNVGQVAGRDVVQVYVSLPGSKVVRVPRELKGFGDITLEPGVSGRLKITIPAEELAYWSVDDNQWLVEGGDYTISVGASSRDLRLTSTVLLQGNEPRRPLTLQSTFGEAAAVPEFANALSELTGNLGGEGHADAKMLLDIPLSAMAVFTGQSPERLKALLVEVNAQVASR